MNMSLNLSQTQQNKNMKLFMEFCHAQSESSEIKYRAIPVDRENGKLDRTNKRPKGRVFQRNMNMIVSRDMTQFYLDMFTSYYF